MEKEKDNKQQVPQAVPPQPTETNKKAAPKAAQQQAQQPTQQQPAMTEAEVKAHRRKIRQAKRLALIFSMLILVAVVAGMAIWGILHLRPADTTIQGQADCEVVRVSGKLAGRLVELYVKEGDYVHKGQRLAKIYSSTADATLSKAKEMKNVAASQNLKVEHGTRHEIITSAQKMVEQAQAAEEISRKTYERINNLYNEGVVSEQKRDEAKAALDASTAAVAAAIRIRSTVSQIDFLNFFFTIRNNSPNNH